ncbi:methyltransferase [Roseisolibacter sp. H3M3-2]|uniref:methyltransferase family protein n=1 Tax=Roseisolibacter sp. H3M3-2 TaxID=3031323 RepID=UPI0023DCD021|nr:methyltransferase [Roseisolibacter sp. H3M3-2]MDF1503584.1 methyltransferase [Roseisolibacter sp. H3M3-2]
MPSDRDTAGVIAPPPLLYLGTLGAALLVERVLWRPLPTGLAWGARATLALVLLAVAVALLVGALGGFRAARTPPEPWKATRAIVDTGVYARTRNPMYLAFALVYLALALALDSGTALLGVVPLLALVQWGVVRREERYLDARFGDEYRAYRARVRRWL